MNPAFVNAPCCQECFTRDAKQVEKRLCCLGDTVPGKKIKEAVIYNFDRVLYNISSLAQGCLQDCQ